MERAYRNVLRDGKDVRKALIAVLLLAALGFGTRDFFKLGPQLPWRTMDDFPDFYCAGWVLDRGADSFTYEPLRTCEHRFQEPGSFRSRLFAGDPAIAIPAPQPPYDFLAFAALAHLPFTSARTLFGIAIVVAAFGCMAGLSALGVPWLLSIAVIALVAGFVELNTGQIVPFALCAIVWCGVAIAKRRYDMAGLLAAASLIEPTAGLPVVLATACFVPRARPALAAGIFALIGIAFAFSGVAGVDEYVTRVLPAHAVSELHFPFQYGWTYAAVWLGAPQNAARFVGIASYILAVGLTLFAAPRVAGTLRRRELLAFVPALGAVVAGPFLHQEELCFAIPALTILALSTSGRTRTLFAVALCVLSVPWIAVWSTKSLFIFAVSVCIAIVACVKITLRPAVVIVVTIALALFVLQHHPPSLPAPPPLGRTYAPQALVQNEWRDYTALRATNDPLWFYVKFPAWLALLASLSLILAVEGKRSAVYQAAGEN